MLIKNHYVIVGGGGQRANSTLQEIFNLLILDLTALSSAGLITLVNVFTVISHTRCTRSYWRRCAANEESSASEEVDTEQWCTKLLLLLLNETLYQTQIYWLVHSTASLDHKSHFTDTPTTRAISHRDRAWLHDNVNVMYFSKKDPEW